MKRTLIACALSVVAISMTSLLGAPSVYAQTKKASAESTQWRQVANYHSALIELMNHHVDVFNDTSDEARVTELLLTGKHDETPTFKVFHQSIDATKQALNPPAQLGADQATIKSLVNTMHGAYLDYTKAYAALQNYMEDFDKGQQKYRYELDKGKVGLPLVAKLMESRSQFSSSQQQLSESIEKLSENLFAKSVEKDPLKVPLVSMNADLNQAKRVLRALRSKQTETGIQDRINALAQAQKTHADADEKLFQKHGSDVLSHYNDFYQGLGNFIETATTVKTKIDSKVADSNDYSGLVQIYNAIVDSFNRFTDR